ncbi:MAG: cytochrome c3 family protein [bacterium]
MELSLRKALQILWLVFIPALAFSQPNVIDNETCLDCHEDYDQTLSSTVHKLASDLPGSRITIGCVSCHSGAEVHIEDPDPENIGNPAKQLAAETAGVCTSCHSQHVHLQVAGFDPHLNRTTSCTDCHLIHGGHEKLLADDEGDFCATCHSSIMAQFSRRSNHPLTDQAVTCLSCHDFTGVNDVSLGHGSNANCYRCHPEQAGPYRHEHQAVSSFATEGEGCTTCHQPHGSPNERLLTQPGNGLCRQCHGIPPLHLSKHGGVGARFACVECHSQVHGSYDSRAFLDPELDVKIGDQPGSCYCHRLNEF